MKLSPHEIVWLVDNVMRLAGTDTITGLPHRVVGCAVFLGESGGDTEVMAVSADTVKDPATGLMVPNPNAGNRDHGLVQASGRWQGDKLKRHAEAGEDWRDPYVAAEIALEIYTEAERVRGPGKGWFPWKVYGEGAATASFRKHVKAAEIGARFPWPPPRPQRVQVTVTVNDRTA